MKRTYCMPASAHRGDVESMTLQAKSRYVVEVSEASMGALAAGCGLSFGL
jgi:hypothetical protein